VWFSIDQNATFFAGVKVNLMDLETNVYPYTPVEFNILIPFFMDIGHA
jgi:hypothetical protein